MRKLFGEVNLTWLKIIVIAIVMGLYTGIMAMLPIVADTSFSDLTVSFEIWVLFGIFIIMNSKSAMDSALKCFVFFLISQPLVYVIQDIINNSSLFTMYYKNWVVWTVACIPMGFVGYYMKKDKWWGLLILSPILILLGHTLAAYFAKSMFLFPRHVLTTLFCLITLFVYPLYIVHKKKLKVAGLIISSLISVVAIVMCLLKPHVYSTIILCNGEQYKFDDTYNAYFMDNKYGELSIQYENRIKSWVICAEFTKGGQTEFILESPDGKTVKFDIIINMNTYSIEEKR